MGFSPPLWGLAPVCGFQPTPDHLHLTHIFYSCLPACGLWTSAWDMKTKKVKVESLSRVQLFGTPWTVAYQVPPSIRFSRQEYWSGLPFPSPGYLPNPGIEPTSPALQQSPTLQVVSLSTKPPGKISKCIICKYFLPFSRLPSLFDSFLFRAKVF